MLRVIATAPETTELYRMDLLVAVAARERLWLTDAYFMATPPYRQALRSAALDGVDVRLWCRTATSSGSRTSPHAVSVSAGVRRAHLQVERPDGARQDGGGRRSLDRIGSTNLNLELARQLGLDVGIEDEDCQ
jgi:hypothetical protein